MRFKYARNFYDIFSSFVSKQVVDYRDTHFSTPIKEQRECGACWAFAPTEVMEAMRFGFRSAKVEKIAKSLSVQHLIDCSGKTS